MRIYISGKITGREKEDYQKQFCEVAQKLREAGNEVVNPAVHDYDLNYWGYMKVSMLLLEMCDAIFMLPGWEDSKGACLEKARAESIGITILGEING